MIVVLAELTAPPAASTQLSGALTALAGATLTESGCLRYKASQDLAEPGQFHLNEVWRDEAALAAHFRSGHMASFLSIARQIGVTSRFMQYFETDSPRALNPTEFVRQHS